MNEHDSERIAGLLEADGMVRATSEAESDVIVLNTCCIRENADNKLYGTLGNLKPLKAQKPGMQIAVGGCLAQKDRDLIRQRASHVDVVFGTHNVDRAAFLLSQASKHGPVVEILEATATADGEAFPSALPTKREVDHASWVTIQIGCDNSCAFCIVPAVRGPEISRAFGELVAEVESLAQDGVSEITLLGQNVNSYGRDLTLARRAAARNGSAEVGGGFFGGSAEVGGVFGDSAEVGGAHSFLPGPANALRAARNGSAEVGGVLSDSDRHHCGDFWLGDRRARPLFADLLRKVGEVEGIRRVRFTSPHPKDMRQETFDAMAQTPAVCEHLHFPLQSGSDKVLSAMHRGYTAERYLHKLSRARKTIGDLAVSTDIIVGFPGETNEDFERTLKVAAEAEFDSAFTFVFSPRPGTEAAEMSGKFVDSDVVKDRYRRLRVVVERLSLASNERRVGLTEEVVVEGASKKDSEMLTGRTRRNTVVHFRPPAPLRNGTYAMIDIEAAGMNHLRGTFVDVVSEPRSRRRIALSSI